MSRQERSAKRAKDRRETKPEEERLRGYQLTPEDLTPDGMREAIHRVYLQCVARGSVAVYPPTLEEPRAEPKTLRTEVGRHTLYTRNDYTLVVVGER
jgi:hypothetical protein